MCVHEYIFIGVSVCACVCVYLCMYLCVFVGVCVGVLMRVCICIVSLCVCMCLCVCLCVYVCTSICASGENVKALWSGQFAKLSVHVYPPQNMLTVAFVPLNVSEKEVDVYRNAL